ncbi:MAG: metallophosphoesterase [Planctomycetaceae bacterium]|nr:metallophosphoesterase [Planctomycetaceae bacterium]
MPSLPTQIDGPIAVIGDVHGQVEKFNVVLDKLRALPDYQQRWIVFIGDLVDRGPNPKGALDAFLKLTEEHAKTTAIAGNHELAMAGALGLVPVPDYSNWDQRWVENYNAETTFASYGLEPGDLDGLKSALPVEHAELLKVIPWVVEHPQLLFVHAGLDSNTPCDLQLRILRERDFTLNRPAWLCSKTFVESSLPPDCRRTVISGHVPVPEVIIRPKRMLIDTTGGVTGELSCVLHPENLVVTSGAGPAKVQRPVAPQRASKPKSAWWKIW